MKKQIANKNIRINSISPGNIFSPGGTWDKKIKKDKAFVKKYIQGNSNKEIITRNIT